MAMDIDKYSSSFSKLNIDLDERKKHILSGYMDDILTLNKSVNLTAVTDRDEFIKRHYMDSLMCARDREFLSSKTIIDIGTGAGFPGIPLAVCFPEKMFTLIDSLKKRIKIIQDLCLKYGLKNVRVLHGRAEDLARDKNLRENFDVCVSRAVANMNTLSEYCLPFVNIGGYFIAYKSAGCEDEINGACHAIKILGGRIDRTNENYEQMEKFTSKHILIYVKKVSYTPNEYPRRAGKPSKMPL